MRYISALHPEKRVYEFFLGNFAMIDINCLIRWKSKRLGKRAYDEKGKPVKQLFKGLEYKHYPIFISKEEVRRRNKRIFKKLKTRELVKNKIMK